MTASHRYHPPAEPPFVVRRARLEDVLEGAWATGRAVLVEADEASGKTTAVASWFVRHGAPRAWLNLTRWDDDPVHLWGGVVGALARADVLSGADVPFDREVTSGVWGDAVLDGISARLHRGCTLVLDGAEHVHDPRLLHALATIGDRVPGLRLVVTTRPSPPLRVALAAQAPLVIDGQDLRCDLDEALAILRWAGAAVDADTARALRRRTGGRPMLLAGCGRLLVDGETDLDAELFASGRPLTEALVEALLSRLPDDRRAFLEAVSVLDDVDALEAAHLSGRHDAESVLDAFTEHRVLNRLGVPGRYAMPRPVAAALRRLVRERDAARAASLHRQAADRARADDRPVDAVVHLIAAGDRPAAFELLAHHAPGLVRGGHQGTVRKLLQELQDVPADREPGTLLRVAGLQELAGRFTATLTTLACVESRGAAAPGSELAVEAAALAASSELAVGDPAAARDGLSWLVTIDAPSAAERSVQRRFGSHLVRSLAWLDDPAAARDAYERLVHRPDVVPGSGDDLFDRTLHWGALAHAALAEGHLAEAVELTDRVVAASLAHLALHPVAVLDVRLVRGAVLRAQGELERAVELLTTVLTDALDRQHLVYAVRAATELARASSRLGDGDAALRDLHRARHLAAENVRAESWRAWLDLAECEVRLDLGQTAAAARLAELLAGAHLAPVLRARARLRLGDPQGARAALAAVAPADVRLPSIALPTRLLACELDAPRAAAHLTAAVELARGDGVVDPFATLPEAPRAVLRTLLEPAERPVDLRIVRLLEQVPPPTDAEPAQYADALTAREREILEHLATGRPLTAIAATLFISPNTLKSHLRSIYGKLGATGREEAVRRSTGLLDRAG